jgi:hypothetical protein
MQNQQRARPRLRRFAKSSVLVLLSLCALTKADAQSTLDVEHSLKIPNDRTPWAVDTYKDRSQLVPIHHSTIAVNRHIGANVAGSVAGSIFYKPRLTTELDGMHSRTQLHGKTPILYLLIESNQDPGGEGRDADVHTFAIVRAVQHKNKRVVDSLSYTQLTGNAKRHGEFIETSTTQMPGGWIRIEPKAPMDEGEYCLLPIPKSVGSYATVVYDFGIDPAAPNEKDAIPATNP